uniref:Uncharacterized protein n=1 Tax=Nelumbo nucifera TaxID=4432 RepID=A0A822ZDV4_NELNU|nr:TPA_asm: hypothetical protein HUJ06_014101 [Nelumbo nucifera]
MRYREGTFQGINDKNKMKEKTICLMGKDQIQALLNIEITPTTGKYQKKNR